MALLLENRTLEDDMIGDDTQAGYLMNQVSLVAKYAYRKGFCLGFLVGACAAMSWVWWMLEVLP